MAWLSENNFTPTDSLHADDLNNLANDIRAWGGNVNGGGNHLSNVIIDNYFPGSGQPSLSPIHVIPTATDYSSQVRLDSEQAGNPARWIIIKDATPETGSNAGSNFALERCDDTGNVLSTPIAINRATGLMTVGPQQWGGNVNGGGFTLTNVVIPGVFQDPTTTQGDLVGHGASGPATRIPVGPNGTVLQADSTQPLGVKWATSPAVPPSTQIIAGPGLSGGGPLTGNVTLSANVLTVFGRTGNVVLTAADIGGIAVPVTRNVIAGAGMSGGGVLSADVTLNALVTSVFGRTGAVVLTAADITSGGGVPGTRQVIAGAGMSGGGALSADVTLNALVTSVFGRTGAVTLTAADISAGGGVPSTRQILTATGSGLAGGGALSADLNLSVVNDTTIQKVNWASGGGAVVGARSTLNFIAGSNITLGLADNSAANRMDVTINGTGVTGIWYNGSLIGNRPAINFIAGSNVTITAQDDSTYNRVDITISAVGGTGGGASQTPWLGPVDAAGNTLSNAALIGVNRAADATARVAVQTSGSELGVRVAAASSANVSVVEADNDNATVRVQLAAYGSTYGGTLQATGGLNMAASAPMTFAIGGAEAMRVSSGRRVLIGTSSDDGAHILQVNGAIKSLAGGIVFPDGTTQTTAITSTGMQDPTTTLGDLIVRGSAVTTRLAVGPNNQALIADSTAPVGVRWGVITNSFNGRTGAVVSTSGDYTAAMVTNAVDQTQSYANPVWITSLAWAKVTGAPPQWSLGASGAIYYNGGNVGIGNNGTPPFAPAAYVCLTIGNGTQAGAGEFTLLGNDTAVGGFMGSLNWANTNTAAADKRIAYIAGFLDTTGPAAGAISFNTYNSAGTRAENMRITSSGNIGIGTTSPGYPLHVYVPTTYAQAMLESTGTGDTGLLMKDANRQWKLGINVAVIGAGKFSIFDVTAGASRLTIDGLGNVGIGTYASQTRLAVTGPSGGYTGSGIEGIAQFTTGTGAATDSKIQFGVVDNSYGWIQAIKPGAVTLPLVLQPGAGNVGIGTASPAATLEVDGSFLIKASAPQCLMQTTGVSVTAGGLVRWTASGGTMYYQINTAAAGDFTSALYPVTITSAGLVCIGTTAPDQKFTVDGGNAAIRSAGMLVLRPANNAYDADINCISASSGYNLQTGFASLSLVNMVHNSNGYTGIGQPFASGVIPNELLSILPSSNRITVATANQLAIGEPTNNPGFRLNLGYYLQGSSAWTGSIQALAGGTGAPLVLNPQGGVVGINKISPAYQLDVTGDVNCTGVFRVNGTPISTGGSTSPGGSTGAVQINNNGVFGGNTSTGAIAGDLSLSNASAGGSIMFSGGSNNLDMQLLAGGHLYIGMGTRQSNSNSLQLGTDLAAKTSTTTWMTTSDIRLKEEVTPFVDGLAALRRVRPIRYKFRPTGERSVGIDAAAHKDILPDCVGTDPGEIDGVSTNIYSFNSHALFFMLINAVQELAARLEKLESPTIH